MNGFNTSHPLTAIKIRFKSTLILFLSLSLSLFWGCSEPEKAKIQSEDTGGGMNGGGMNEGGVSMNEGGGNISGQGGNMSESMGGEMGGNMGPQVCMPAEEEFEGVRDFIDQYCGLCHQDPPQFGAPYAFNDLDFLLDGPEGMRPLDRMVARLVEGTMPPAGQPQPTSADAQAFLDWATCDSGIQRTPNLGGFEVSRPLYQGPNAPPQEASVLEMRASGVVVPENRDDQYNCFQFNGPSQGSADRSILRIEPIIDDARVVHHIVLYEANGEVDDQQESECGAGLGAGVYAWAPGQTPLHFKEGGLISRQGQNYILEIHYNNQAQYDDVNDYSGVRVYHSDLVEPQIDMVTLGPDAFTLPAQSRTQVVGECEIEDGFEILALMPHMHEIGQSLNSTIIRANEQEEDLIDLQGWDFNFQLVYDGEGIQVQPGDRIKTSCVFENEDPTPRSYGPFTEDEMCYNFVYVTPPPSEKRCNRPIVEESSYQPGMCGPSGGETWSEPIIGFYQEGMPPAPTGGVVAAGQYRLSGLDVWFESFNLGIAVVDSELSYYDAQGALNVGREDQFELDLQGLAYLTSEQGASFMREINLNFGGIWSVNPANMTQLKTQVSCPQESQPSFGYTVDDNRLWLYLSFSDPVEGIQVMEFERVEEE